MNSNITATIDFIFLTSFLQFLSGCLTFSLLYICNLSFLRKSYHCSSPDGGDVDQMLPDNNLDILWRQSPFSCPYPLSVTNMLRVSKMILVFSWHQTSPLVAGILRELVFYFLELFHSYSFMFSVTY